MSKIYKVTNTKITTSKNGYTIFNLELNNQIWASKLAPVRKSEKKYNKLYQIYEENKTLDSLIGKLITTTLEKSNYGINFDSISSYDSLIEFKELLDKSEKKAFSTDIPIYGFLKLQNYSINSDNSITLKEPYSYYNIRSKDNITICYPNNLKSDELTFDNISIIYDHFYHEKCTESSLDADCKYVLTSIAIIEDWWRYHKTKGGITRRGTRDILRIGDKLNDEHIKFLSSFQ
ncbi:MAG: hypothetical protein U9Q30_03175 [Campylobacterota bacterium]|nr:hypothetical protein [Campylobacterota bacterium]